MRPLLVVVGPALLVIGAFYFCVWLAARRYRRYLEETPVTSRWLHDHHERED